MQPLSLSQSYYLVAINEFDTVPGMRQNQCISALVVAALIELQEAGILTVRDDTFHIQGPLPSTLAALSPLYAYLAEKPCPLNRFKREFLFSSKKKNALLAAIGQSLYNDGFASAMDVGALRKHTVYAPNRAARQALIQPLIQRALDDSALLSKKDACLFFLLGESHSLLQAADKTDRPALKARFKALKAQPENQEWAAMIQFVDTMWLFLN